MRIRLAIALAAAAAAAACSRDEPKHRPRAVIAATPLPNSVQLPALRYRAGDIVMMRRDQRIEMAARTVSHHSSAKRVIVVVDAGRPTRTVVTYDKLVKEIANAGADPSRHSVTANAMYIVERTADHLDVDGPSDGPRIDPASDLDAGVIRTDFTDILPADDFTAVLADKTFAPDVPVELTAADIDRINAIRGTDNCRLIAARFTLSASTVETATLDYEARIALASRPPLQLDATGSAVIDRHTGAWTENRGQGTLTAAAGDDPAGTFEASTTAALSNPTNPRK